MSTSMNIVIFGQAGSGKSSVVNMIAGEQIATVSNGAEACTLSFTPYTIGFLGRHCHIWDTVGLDKADMELVAVEQAVALIHHLINHGGVDLLLFCIRAPRITAAAQANYRLFCDALCRCQVPVALVITHLEREPNMENWWVRNAEQLKTCGLRSMGHACVTGLPMDSRYRESQDKIARLLVSCDANERFVMPEQGWTTEFLRTLAHSSLLTRDAKRKEIIRVLVKRCRMDPRVAKEIADKLDGA